MAFDSEFNRAIAECERSAFHFEARDVYTPDDPDWLAWKVGNRFDPAQRWRSFFELMSATTARGVNVRRARVVSEPVTDYIRFEYDVTAPFNVKAGEHVRWLPRRMAADLLIPACDLWVFDSKVVIFNHFAGDGSWLGEERRDDSALAATIAEAFEAVWERGIPHDQYRPS